MLIELPIGWIVVLNVVGWPVIQFGLAWLFTLMPVTWFEPEWRAPVGAGRAFLRTHVRYQTMERPAARCGALVRAEVLPKASLAGLDPAYLRRFIRETWRGELCHWFALWLCSGVLPLEPLVGRPGHGWLRRDGKHSLHPQPSATIDCDSGGCSPGNSEERAGHFSRQWWEFRTPLFPSGRVDKADTKTDTKRIKNDRIG